MAGVRHNDNGGRRDHVRAIHSRNRRQEFLILEPEAVDRHDALRHSLRRRVHSPAPAGKQGSNPAPFAVRQGAGAQDEGPSCARASPFSSFLPSAIRSISFGRVIPRRARSPARSRRRCILVSSRCATRCRWILLSRFPAPPIGEELDRDIRRIVAIWRERARDTVVPDHSCSAHSPMPTRCTRRSRRASAPMAWSLRPSAMTALLQLMPGQSLPCRRWRSGRRRPNRRSRRGWAPEPQLRTACSARRRSDQEWPREPAPDPRQ